MEERRFVLEEEYIPEDDTPVVYIGGKRIRTTKTMRPREKDDFYETEMACLDAYFANRQFDTARNILDPSAGRGTYGKALRKRYPRIDTLYGVEIKPELEPCQEYTHWVPGDFLLWVPTAQTPEFDLIVSNPPYKFAEEFFWQSLLHINKEFAVISFLLRLGYLASEKRYNSLWTTGYAPTNVTILSKRPSFTGDGKTYPDDFGIFEWVFIDGICQQDQRFDFMVFTRDKQ